MRDELLTWLEDRDYHAVMLQEMWSRNHIEYSTRGWTCVNSSLNNTGRAHAGVMILLRNSIFETATISYHHVEPGRLLHLRARCSGGWIDFVNCYQYCWDLQSQEHPLLLKREPRWQALRSTLGGIPQGHCLVRGDYNTSPPQKLPFAGIGVTTHNKQSPDSDVMMQILSDFQLVASNTFGRSNSCTYIHDGYAKARRSVVDYMITRQKGGPPVRSVAVRDFVVGGWRQGEPACAYTYGVSRSSISTQACESTPTALANVEMQITAAATGERTRLRDKMAENVPQQVGSMQQHDPAQLNQILLDAVDQIFQAQKPQCKPPPRTQQEHIGLIRSMWTYCKQMQQARAAKTNMRNTLRNAFQIWTPWFKFRSIHKVVQKHSKQLRRERFNQLLHDATEADRTRRTHLLFDLLKRRAPKHLPQRAQLRTADGRLMKSVEEAHVLADYWISVYNSGQNQTTRTQPCPTRSQQKKYGIPCNNCRAIKLRPHIVHLMYFGKRLHDHWQIF